MAQTKCGYHRLASRGVEVPWLLAVEWGVGRVQTVDRAERAELVPSGLQFLVPVAEHMPAYVMAPPSVADVRSHRRKVRLEFQ